MPPRFPRVSASNVVTHPSSTSEDRVIRTLEQGCTFSLGLTRSCHLCVCAHCTRPHWHMQERGAGGMGGGANAALARVLAARQGQGGRGFGGALVLKAAGPWSPAPIYEPLRWMIRRTPRPQAAFAWTQIRDVLADHERPAFVLARRHSAVRPLSRPPWQSCPSWATRSTSTKVHSLQRASETTHVDTPSTPWRLTCRPFTRSRPVRRQLGSTSHKRRVDGGEATTALALVDEADTRPAAPRHHLQRCLPVPSRGLGI